MTRRNTRRDIRLDDDGVLEYPDNYGVIRRKDVHGNCEEIRRPGDENYLEWWLLFEQKLFLNSCGIVLHVVPGVAGMGSISSQLLEGGETAEQRAAVDTLEAFVLACACAGMNVQSPQFLEALETTVDKLFNQ